MLVFAYTPTSLGHGFSRTAPEQTLDMHVRRKTISPSNTSTLSSMRLTHWMCTAVRDCKSDVSDRERDNGTITLPFYKKCDVENY